MNKTIALSKTSKQRYAVLCKKLGVKLARFVLCAYCNVPYMTSIDESCDWDTYISVAEEIAGDGNISFDDGETEINEILKKDGEEEKTDLDTWRILWGRGNEKENYTEKDYKKLDKLFRMFTERKMRCGGLSDAEEYAYRFSCRAHLAADKALEQGTKDGVSMSKSLLELSQRILDDSGLGVKDQTPLEEARLDGIVDALQKKYNVEASLSFDEAVEICCKWYMSHKYPFTRDCADKILLSLENAARRNNDMPAILELPEEDRMPEESTEFAKKPNETEKAVYQYLGLVHDEGN